MYWIFEGCSLARCPLQHLPVTELPAEDLSICHGPMHRHELGVLLVPVKAAQGEDSSLPFISQDFKKVDINDGIFIQPVLLCETSIE